MVVVVVVQTFMVLNLLYISMLNKSPSRLNKQPYSNHSKDIESTYLISLTSFSARSTMRRKNCATRKRCKDGKKIFFTIKKNSVKCFSHHYIWHHVYCSVLVTEDTHTTLHTSLFASFAPRLLTRFSIILSGYFIRSNWHWGSSKIVKWSIFFCAHNTWLVIMV